MKDRVLANGAQVSEYRGRSVMISNWATAALDWPALLRVAADEVGRSQARGEHLFGVSIASSSEEDSVTLFFYVPERNSDG